MPKKLGRPVLYQSDDERPVVISVRLPPALYARLERYTKIYRQTITELVRDGLEWRLEQDDPRSQVATLFNDENTGLQETLQQMIDARVQAALDAQQPARGEPLTPVHEAIAPTGEPSRNGNTVLQPRLEKAALVARLQQMREGGMSLSQIADQLRREGVPTLSGKGQWQKGTVDKLLGAITV